MGRTRQFLITMMLILSISSISLAGTITGSRASRTGTITGSRVGTITGSKSGTITGSRRGTGRTVQTTNGFPSDNEWLSRVMTFVLNLYY